MRRARRWALFPRAPVGAFSALQTFVSEVRFYARVISRDLTVAVHTNLARADWMERHVPALQTFVKKVRFSARVITRELTVAVHTNLACADWMERHVPALQTFVSEVRFYARVITRDLTVAVHTNLARVDWVERHARAWIGSSVTFPRIYYGEANSCQRQFMVQPIYDRRSIHFWQVLSDRRTFYGAAN